MIKLTVYDLRKRFRNLFVALCLPAALQAQTPEIQVASDAAQHIVTITADGQAFTTFMYPDTLEKPVLYPIYASDGQLQRDLPPDLNLANL